MIPRHFQITTALLLLAILFSGLYMIHLRQREEAASLQSLQAAPSVPVLEGKQERIRVLVAYDEDQALRWRDAEVFMPVERSSRARAALRAALSQYLQSPSPHPLGKGADIRNVYLINNDTMVVDTTSQFADAHPPGILLEEFTIASLIETLTANVSGVTKVKFLVNGQERETLAGHVDLMSFYQTAAVHELAKEFE
ncbi:MAG TPA: GerMN domain-containing protein [Candidatus Angelobacter sp.]|nr:GerMN domain-containing protein [Candidatus Angelobacter sp.]